MPDSAEGRLLSCSVQQTFSVNGQIANILGFGGQMVSLTITKLCCGCVKRAIDNMDMNKCGCVAITFYFQK